MVDGVLIIDKIIGLLPFLETLAAVLVAIALFSFCMVFVKKAILNKVHTKSQISSIKIFFRILNISFAVLVLIVAFLSYIESWEGVSIVIGLLTAALGFALQRPITGIAAWLMVVFKRPFRVGDRITINGVKGDVYDITLTHIYMDEVGGSIDTEQHTGRNIMIPNYRLFEENIINHTLINDYILDEINLEITYESDLDKAMLIAYECANALTYQYSSRINKDAKTRISLEASGIRIRVLFYAPVQEISKIKSDITKRIYDKIKKEKNISFAYPHSEIILKKDTNIYKKH